MSNQERHRKKLLKTNNIKKTFKGNVALKDVSFSLFEGECIALVGENGAGKSTLMKILSGVYENQEGKIFIKEKLIDKLNPKKAQQLGISIIHQEFNLIPDLTVYENVFLGREKEKNGLIDKSFLRFETQKLIDYIGVNINPDETVNTLSVAEKQIVEIVKSLSTNAEVIIMDEPSAALNTREVEKLFEIIYQLKNEGKGIIYISHRLEELSNIVDRIYVLRDGALVKELGLDATISEIVKHMVGRDVENLYPKVNKKIGKVILEVNNLTDFGQLNNINFEVREGEIVGIAGLEGSGQLDLAKLLYGTSKMKRGYIKIKENKLIKTSPYKSIKNGIGMISEDRKDEGLFLQMSLAFNTTLSSMSKILNSFRLISNKKEKKESEEAVKSLKIKTDDINQSVLLLSGGNQQKVVLAKVLMSNPDVIIMCEPTRGVDINAKKEIYKLLSEFVQEGKAIILISSDLPEVIEMSNRVLVMSRGEISASFSHNQATQENIMYYATGGNLVKEGE